MSLVDIALAATAALPLLEAKGLKHKRHAKHLAPARAKIEAVLRSYWKRQETALLREIRPRLEHLLAAHPVPLREARTPASKNFASSLLPTSLSPLRFPVTKGEDSEYYAAISDAIKGAAATLTEELAAGEHTAEDFAGRYLRDNSLSKLTGNFAKESVERLQGAVADAWQAGGSYDQIVKAVQDTFADFSDARAGMIAQTEANDAYNEARDQVARDADLDEKAWETESGDPCEICLANEAQGWIGIDEDFESGDDAPTAHPRCCCSLNYRRAA